LRTACAVPSLREEIQSLIVAHEQADTGALNSAALPSISKSAPSARLELTNGTRLGDFQILSLLGAGGMGEAYRARDLRLERDVAIKALPRFVSLDPERLRRFEQDAKAAAGLSHSNILAVFHPVSFVHQQKDGLEFGRKRYGLAFAFVEMCQSRIDGLLDYFQPRWRLRNPSTHDSGRGCMC
jgi:serine/threonine protein kinase